MITHYPVIYISTKTGKVVEYDWVELGTQPFFFPNMELFIDGETTVVVRVHVGRVSDTQPVIYVLVAPSLKESFITDEHVDIVKNIFDYHETQDALEAKQDSLGDAMQKELEHYKWN